MALDNIATSSDLRGVPCKNRAVSPLLRFKHSQKCSTRSGVVRTPSLMFKLHRDRQIPIEEQIRRNPSLKIARWGCSGNIIKFSLHGESTCVFITTVCSENALFQIFDLRYTKLMKNKTPAAQWDICWPKLFYYDVF